MVRNPHNDEGLRRALHELRAAQEDFIASYRTPRDNLRDAAMRTAADRAEAARRKAARWEALARDALRDD